MAPQEFVGPVVSSRRDSQHAGRGGAFQPLDALRKIALAFQAVTRAGRIVPMEWNTASDELSILRDRVKECAAQARAAHMAPEQVFVRMKSVTTALSGNLAPTASEMLADVVLKAFLAGYYGDVAPGPKNAGVIHRGRMG